MRINFLILAVISILLSACAGITTTDNAELSWRGKFSLQTKYQTSQDRHSGNFSLAKYPNSYLLDITGPFGTKVAKIDETESGSTLTYSDGKLMKSATTDALLEQTLGFPLSLSQLVTWIQNPQLIKQIPNWKINYTLDPSGKLSRLTAEAEETDVKPAVKLILLIKSES